jgi:hypothetical protein
MARADLVEVYISGLNLAAVLVVANGRRCRIITGDEFAPGEKITAQFFFRSSGHAELVLAQIDQGSVSGKPADALAASVELAAAKVGAAVISPDRLKAFAEAQVSEIIARVNASGRRGKLKHWNARYRLYRLERIAKCEPVISYQAFLEQAVILPTVRNIAILGRTV